MILSQGIINKVKMIVLCIILCALNAYEIPCLAQIISFWVFILFTVIIMKADFLHPYVWFLGMHTVYATGYPIMHYYGHVTPGITITYTNEPLFLAAIAALTFVILVPGKHVPNGSLIRYPQIKVGNNRLLLHVLTFIFMLSAVFIKAKGYQGKNEIYTSSKTLTIVFSLILIYINLYIFDLGLELVNGNKIKIVPLIEVGLSSLLLTMFSGERDLLFRFLVITVMMLLFFKRINKKTFILLAMGFVLLIPITVAFKYYFLSGHMSAAEKVAGESNILTRLISGEFESASRNLQIILNHKQDTKGIMHGKTILSAFTRAFGFSLARAARWFQDTYFPNRRTGMGFTLIGEGYINFGYPGVVLVYVIIGFLIRILYLHHNKNIYFMYLYFSCIPLLIYINRADLANFFSPFLRHTILSLVIFYCFKIRTQAVNMKWLKNLILDRSFMNDSGSGI